MPEGLVIACPTCAKKFKLPERLTVVNEFPISPAGKILRRELRQVAAKTIANAHA